MLAPSDAIEQYESSLQIAASPDKVYALVSDVTRMGEWSPENTGAEWLRGGSGNAGDWFVGHNKAGEREWSRECEVAVADPGKDFTFVVGGVEDNCTWWSYEIEAAGHGSVLTERWWFVNKTPAMEAASAEQYAGRLAMTGPMIDATLVAIKAAAEQ